MFRFRILANGGKVVAQFKLNEYDAEKLARALIPGMAWQTRAKYGWKKLCIGYAAIEIEEIFKKPKRLIRART